MSKAKLKVQFKCEQITLYENGEVVALKAVTYGAKVNESVTTGQSTGEFQLRVDKDAPGAGFFDVGEEYTMEFVQVAKTVVKVPEGMPTMTEV